MRDVVTKLSANLEPALLLRRGSPGVCRAEYVMFDVSAPNMHQAINNHQTYLAVITG